eukprot:PhM_4_TR1948/c1_g1_i1/m.26447
MSSAHDQAVALMKAFKSQSKYKSPSGSMRSTTNRFADPKPVGNADYANLKGMGDIKKAAKGSSWARASADVRPVEKSVTQNVPMYCSDSMTLAKESTKRPGASSAMRSTTSRLVESPRSTASAPFVDIKGMGDVKKSKASAASFRSTAPRLPEPRVSTQTFYDVKGGVGDVKKAPKGSYWAKSTAPVRPTEKCITANCVYDPKDPNMKPNSSSRSSFVTTSERMNYEAPTKNNPGPGAYASPFISAGMMS